MKIERKQSLYLDQLNIVAINSLVCWLLKLQFFQFGDVEFGAPLCPARTAAWNHILTFRTTKNIHCDDRIIWNRPGWKPKVGTCWNTSIIPLDLFYLAWSAHIQITYTHYITLHDMTLHYITFYNVLLHDFLLHYTRFYCIKLQYMSIYYEITLHCITCFTWNCTALQNILLHEQTLHYHFKFIAQLHYVTLHCITLSYIILHEITVHQINEITLHYAINQSVHTHIQIYTYTITFLYYM